jgi:hypothetical protein
VSLARLPPLSVFFADHTSRPDKVLFFADAHFLKQLPTHIAHIAKAPQANAETKALAKSAMLPTKKADQ